MKFELTPGPGVAGHTQPRVQLHSLTQAQCARARHVVCNNYMTSSDYKIKGPANPFLQGYQEPYKGKTDGWVLIEFWTDDLDAVQKFVDHLNARTFDGVECTYEERAQ